MLKSEQASLSVIRIAIITILTIFALSAYVLGADTDVKNVKIILADNCEIDVLTTKTTVADILKENHVVVLPEENVVPNLDSEITNSYSKIVITGVTQDKYAAISASEEEEELKIDKLLSSYSAILEKIVVIEEKIPYETITKDSSNGNKNSTIKVVQEGKEGTKKSTYKIKYQNEIEISRTLISEEIIEEPISKIVEHASITNRGDKTNTRVTEDVPISSNSELAKKVEGITPVVKTMNASAYTASDCGKSADSPGYGRTASGEKANAWHTIAAGKGYPIGTIMYIPYFASAPNEGWFVVQDRGGAISNSKIDIYMNTSNECIKFGRRNLECYVYVIK